MKKKILFAALAATIGGTVLGGTIQAANITEDPVEHTITICGHEYLTDTDDCITMMDRNLGANEAGTGCRESNYACEGGWETYGMGSYEECFSACISWDESAEFCEEYCGQDLKGYNSLAECNAAFEECIAASSGVYGLYYQWGNNYGFDPSKPITTGTQKVDCSIYNPFNPFSSSTFTLKATFDINDDTTRIDDYCNPRNDNMWGGGEDRFDYNIKKPANSYPVTNAEERQGPCPNGYHVPSLGEWYALVDMRAGREMLGAIQIESRGGIHTEEDVEQFQNDFKIPFAGQINWFSLTLSNKGEWGPFWTSSPNTGDEVMSFLFRVAVPSANAGNNPRGQGFPIRCFKNPTTTNANDAVAHIHVTVAGGDISIGTDTGASDTLTKNLGELNISNNIQTITGDFGANSFWVEDMKGNESGYYTTLSVSDMIGDVNSGHIIPKANIQLRPTAVTKISGAEVLESKVVLGDSWNDWTNITWTGNESAVTYFNRQDTATADAGRVGKWGDNLQIKVSVPAHTVADTYRGTLTYTLYEL